MTVRGRLLAPVVLLALSFACGKGDEEAPVATQPAAATRGVPATEGAASSPSEATGTAPAAKMGAAASAVDLPGAGGTPETTPARAAPAPPPAPTPPPAPPPAPPPVPAPAPPATLPPGQRPEGKITLPAKLGAVTFDHEMHAGEREIACTTCHHPSRPERPLVSERQACRDCHAMPAAQPMKTSLRTAFHDARATSGTCIDCHKEKGDPAPVKCLECHEKK